MVTHDFKGATGSNATSGRIKKTDSAEVIRVTTNIQVLTAAARLSSLKSERDVTNNVGTPWKKGGSAGIRSNTII
jgi:hypothetical protein